MTQPRVLNRLAESRSRVAGLTRDAGATQAATLIVATLATLTVWLTPGTADTGAAHTGLTGGAVAAAPAASIVSAELAGAVARAGCALGAQTLGRADRSRRADAAGSTASIVAALLARTRALTGHADAVVAGVARRAGSVATDATAAIIATVLPRAIRIAGVVDQAGAIDALNARSAGPTGAPALVRATLFTRTGWLADARALLTGARLPRPARAHATAAVATAIVLLVAVGHAPGFTLRLAALVRQAWRAEVARLADTALGAAAVRTAGLALAARLTHVSQDRRGRQERERREDAEQDRAIVHKGLDTMFRDSNHDSRPSSARSA